MAKDKRFEALQFRDFRIFWFGQGVSSIGTEMQKVAIDWNIFQILRGEIYELNLFGWSIDLDAGALGLGAMGLVRVVPIMLFALLGGILADVIERRKLLIWSESLSAIFAATLAILVFSGYESVGLLYTISALLAASTSVSTPTRQSLVPNLVPRKFMTNAVSLNSLLFQVGTITGPAVAGILIGISENSSLVYLINAFSFIGAIISLVLMRHRSKAALESPISLDMVKEGLQFTYNEKTLWGSMLLDFFATLFGSAKTMLPIIAVEVLGLDAGGYGILLTAQPLGAFLTGLVMAWVRDLKNQGKIMFIGVGVYGLATMLFGISPFFALSYFFYALTGVGDTVSMVVRQTMRQVVTPDHLRGRATSISMIFFMGGPQLGEAEAGAVAAVFGAPFAIFSGGIAVVLATGFIAWRYPRLRNYDPNSAEYAHLDVSAKD
ncbi:MAG: MFS transporter [Chloroflexota bacterium]